MVRNYLEFHVIKLYWSLKFCHHCIPLKLTALKTHTHTQWNDTTVIKIYVHYSKTDFNIYMFENYSFLSVMYKEMGIDPDEILLIKGQDFSSTHPDKKYYTAMPLGDDEISWNRQNISWKWTFVHRHLTNISWNQEISQSVISDYIMIKITCGHKHGTLNSFLP